MKQRTKRPKNSLKKTESILTMEPEEISSPVLTRLINEVRNEEHQPDNMAYNRFHNRHNRSR